MTAEIPLLLMQSSNVLFPGMVLVQNIREVKYIAVLRVCHESREVLGFVLKKGEKVHSTGCLARIHQIVEDEEDDSIQILLKGEERFRITEWVSESDPVRVRYEKLADSASDTGDDSLVRLQSDVLQAYKKIVMVVKPEKFVQIADVTSQLGMSFPLAATTVFDVSVKQKILEETTEVGRLGLLAGYYRSISPKIASLGGNGFFIKD